ncbi:MAG: FtsX-like permease family protein [Vicinamibacteraceae bacterium]
MSIDTTTANANTRASIEISSALGTWLTSNAEAAVRVACAALGARTSDVLRLVIVEGMSPTLTGIAVGVIVALASARAMKSLVFGVSASDPLTLAAVAATLAVVALLASLVPAYRASPFRPCESPARGVGIVRLDGFNPLQRSLDDGRDVAHTIDGTDIRR